MIYYSLGGYESKQGQSLKDFCNDIAEHIIDKTDLEDDCAEFEADGFYLNTEDSCLEISEEGCRFVEDYINGILEEDNEERSSVRKYGTWQEQERRAYYSNQL